MNSVTTTLCALVMACVLAAGTIGPSDTEAAQDVFDDALTAQQAAECRHQRGPDAAVFVMGQHTVCRGVGPVAGVTR